MRNLAQDMGDRKLARLMRLPTLSAVLCDDDMPAVFAVGPIRVDHRRWLHVIAHCSSRAVAGCDCMGVAPDCSTSAHATNRETGRETGGKQDTHISKTGGKTGKTGTLTLLLPFGARPGGQDRYTHFVAPFRGPRPLDILWTTSSGHPPASRVLTRQSSGAATSCHSLRAVRGGVTGNDRSASGGRKPPFGSKSVVAPGCCGWLERGMHFFMRRVAQPVASSQGSVAQPWLVAKASHGPQDRRHRGATRREGCLRARSGVAHLAKATSLGGGARLGSRPRRTFDGYETVHNTL